MSSKLRLHPVWTKPTPKPDDASRAYDASSETYLAYADGEGNGLFDFTGRHGFTDREIWGRIDAALIRLRTSGRHAIRILDAGCGPGTWLLRTAIRARDLGFTAIDARGFDISPGLIELAKARLAMCEDVHIGISFDVADFANALVDEDDGSYDIVLCLYGVLNHLRPLARQAAADALVRVAADDVFVTVRTVGSLPSICIAGIEKARAFHQDNEHDRLEIDLVDGRHLGFDLHLFTAQELEQLFVPAMLKLELVGLDLFHSRFASDPDWNPGMDASDGFSDDLERLEHLCAHNPNFVNRAAHVLLYARSLDQDACH